MDVLTILKWGSTGRLIDILFVVNSVAFKLSPFGETVKHLPKWWAND